MARRAGTLSGLLLLGLTGCGGPHRHVDEVPLMPTPTTTAAEVRMDWWREARFGLFIHWGLYAIPAGEWNGATGHGEWIRHTAQIPLEEYDALRGQFNPANFDADAWVQLAKDAGMKYIVITSKHHDGFCLFDSQYTDFDVKSTPFGRDILRELADACRRAGLRICWYHSIMDWHHPDYLPRREWESRSTEGADFERYVAHLKHQLAELVGHYGPIGVLWFDGEWENTWNHERGVDLYRYVRGLQPDIIINNRVDVGREGMAGLTKDRRFAGDFGTPEQEIPATGLPGVDWETCMTMNDHWGYNRQDQNWKSSTELIRKLADIASKGGNFLLNVSPTAEGEFPAASVERLRDIGRWMKVNGEAIYGTQASPFKELSWGRCTQKPLPDGNTRLYLHVFDWPADGRLTVPGLFNDAVRACLLADPTGIPIHGARQEDALVLQLPAAMPDAGVTVVALDIVGRPDVADPPDISAETSIFIDTLVVSVTTKREKVELRYTRDGTVPTTTSPLVQGPVRLTQSAVVSARAFRDGQPVSGVAQATFTRVAPRPAEPVRGDAAGVRYAYFEGDWDRLPDFDAQRFTRTGVVPNFELGPHQKDERFGLRYRGFITVPRDGVYTFYTLSDDGSRLSIGDQLVVDNDGLHGMVERSGVIALTAGAHAITVLYFNRTGGAGLEVGYAGPGIKKQRIPDSALTTFAPAPGMIEPSARQRAWQELEFIGFLHFGMNTFTDREWGDGTEDPRLFNPTALDARQWVRACRDAGMKQIIITAKHHDGFCLWPSRYTEHSVKNSPWRDGKGDVVREVADACREAGLKLGIYLSPWDRHEPSYGDSPRYNAYYKHQLTELLTNYGPISEVWFDGACGEGSNGKRQEYDWAGYIAVVRRLQPDAVIFSDAGPDVRWVGNEQGFAGETNWSTLHRGEFYPGTPNAQPLATGHEDGTHWVPAECDVSIRPGWFYHAAEDAQVKPVGQLLDIYYQSVGRNAVMLLNVPPDPRGLIADVDAARLREFRAVLDETFAHDLTLGRPATATDVLDNGPTYAASNAVDGDSQTAWRIEKRVTRAELTIDLGTPVTFDRAAVQEDIRQGQRVRAFAVEAWDGTAWRAFAEGTTIGHKRLLRFDPVTAARVRLVIRDTHVCPAISAFGLFKASPRESPPRAESSAPVDPARKGTMTDTDSNGLALLWQIGQADHSAAELALAPDEYGKFNDRFPGGPLYVVGRSEPQQDWPSVHPGPADAFAGSQPQTFTIRFGLNSAPAGGCRLVVSLVDSHLSLPPKLEIQVNGRTFEHQTPAGSSNTLESRTPAGAPHQFEIPLAPELLRTGDNTITITSLTGCWLVYDSIALEAPAGTELAAVEPRTTLLSTQNQPVRSKPHEGGQLQRLGILIEHTGDPVQAALRVNGREVGTAALRPGRQRLTADVPAVDTATTAPLQVVIAARTVAEQAVELKPVRPWVIYLLHHTHLDIGYTHVQAEVEALQWRHLKQAVELAERTADYPPEARFKWNPEALWAVDGYLRQATSEQRARLIAAIRQGLIGLDALYANELTALCRPEELFELVACARRLAQEYGLTIDSAMITDIPGYTWGLVPTFALNGVKYLSIGPNRSHRIGYTLAEWGDKPFYWVSPSGEHKVLCWMAGRGYSWFHGAWRGQDTFDYRDVQAHIDPQQILDYLGELETGGYPYDLVQIRYNIGSDNGPPDPGLSDFVRDWNATHVSPQFVVTTTSHMFHDFEQRYADAIPTVRGDFTPYWEDGAASSARETALNRGAAERLVQAAALWAMLDPASYPAVDFREAWRQVVLYDEHTWGSWNSISEPEGELTRAQWKIKQALALDADRQSQDLLDRAATARAPREGEPPPRFGAAGAAPSPAGQVLPRPTAEARSIAAVLVHNTCSWARTDLVTVPKEWKLPGDVVHAPEGGAGWSQRLSTGELVFVASVPAFGAAKYTFHPGAVTALPPQLRAAASGVQLTNARMTVTIDESSGAIASLAHKGISRQLVDRSHGPGLNDYLYVAGRKPDDPQRNGAVRISIKENGPLVATLRIESDAPGCNTLVREVSLLFMPADRVDIVNVVDKRHTLTPEGVHLAYPFNVPGGDVRMDVAWGIVRPEVDQIPGACKNYFTVQRWVDVSNRDIGITFASLDAPLVEVGRIATDAPAAGWLRHLEPSSTLYSYVMNNYWETNYKAGQDGATTFRYALQPHGAFDAAATARFGFERSQPLILAPAAADVPVPEPLLNVASDRVLVSSLKPTADGKGWIVRLFNPTEGTGRVQITWNRPAASALWLSNVNEEKVDPWPAHAQLSPWQVVTLRAERP